MRNRVSDCYVVNNFGISHYREGKHIRTYDPTPKNIKRMAGILYNSGDRKKLGATVSPSLVGLGYVVVFVKGRD